MRALVIVESFFGNTMDLATDIAEALGTEVVDVADAPARLPEGLELLLVGGPTHAFGMSRPVTRETAVERGGDETDVPVGLREWIERVTPVSTRVVTFDTTIKGFTVIGGARKAIAKAMRARGFDDVTVGTAFLVGDGKTGGGREQVLEGEHERAREWAAGLLA